MEGLPPCRVTKKLLAAGYLAPLRTLVFRSRSAVGSGLKKKFRIEAGATVSISATPDVAEGLPADVVAPPGAAGDVRLGVGDRSAVGRLAECSHRSIVDRTITADRTIHRVRPGRPEGQGSAVRPKVLERLFRRCFAQSFRVRVRATPLARSTGCCRRKVWPGSCLRSEGRIRSKQRSSMTMLTFPLCRSERGPTRHASLKRADVLGAVVLCDRATHGDFHVR